MKKRHILVFAHTESYEKEKPFVFNENEITCISKHHWSSLDDAFTIINEDKSLYLDLTWIGHESLFWDVIMQVEAERGESLRKDKFENDSLPTLRNSEIKFHINDLCLYIVTSIENKDAIEIDLKSNYFEVLAAIMFGKELSDEDEENKYWDNEAFIQFSYNIFWDDEIKDK